MNFSQPPTRPNDALIAELSNAISRTADADGAEVDLATREAWVRLSLASGVNATHAHKLLAYFGSARAIFESVPARWSNVVGARTVAGLSSVSNDQVALAMRWLEHRDSYLLSWDDKRFPKNLLSIEDVPPALYVKGDPAWLNRTGLAIVGSRNCSAQGESTAEQFAQAASEAGITIISGMALGIDSSAHRGGLLGKGKTVAVVGTGVDRVYPSRNLDLAHQIASEGCLVSEFPLGTPPLPQNFPRRNRIISGLAKGVLVVEATPSSGSLITARLAAEHGREVMAIPGSIHSPFTKGCHKLIREGATLIETVQDVLDTLSWAGRAAAEAPPQRTESPPSESKSSTVEVIGAMGFDAVSVDVLCERTQSPAEAVLAELLSLELDGRVFKLPGGNYQRRG